MKTHAKRLSVILLLVLGFSIQSSAQQSIVRKYGQLSVNGNYIVSEFGDTVQLRGMSMFWSQWMSQYYTEQTLTWLRDDWKCTIIRLAMGVDEDGGYKENPNELFRIIDMVDVAIKLGMYVIIDYHSHHAHKNPELAKKFFSTMARKYGKYPNVIYEIYNEPLQDTYWKSSIKPYAEQVIKAIREHDPDNIIVVGTRQWSQMVSEAAEDPIQDKNIAYTLHFYAVSHGQYLRDEAEKAMKKGVALFVTEFGTCDYSGNGKFGPEETNEWFAFLDKYKISWCNWSVANKKETASILLPVSDISHWSETDLTPSGQYIRNELILKNTPILKRKK
ncbi:glycoside hydrolase family 5 protein [Sporocytophaga myxococcoides]|uniref:glycoside hydrolase family 5 protein n=1 Tax=Sporocytophaga myxococcoides TaxID=153721 RepID=UPI00048ECBCB|nr:glycoside hydrolase family 5 protein [Sporocytophaga myxococcoides]